MNRILHIALVSIGFIICVVGTGFILDKILKKHEKKKYLREFRLMAYAVAEDISAKTPLCKVSNLRNAIDDSLDYCTKFLDLEYDERVRWCYKNADYLHFVWISALKYADQYVDDDPERIAIIEHCEVGKRLIPPEKSSSDLIPRDSTSGYLIALIIWLFVGGIVSRMINL